MKNIYPPKFLIVLFMGMSVIAVGGAIAKTVWANGGEGSLVVVEPQNQTSSAAIAPLALPSGSASSSPASVQVQNQAATSTPAHLSVPKTTTNAVVSRHRRRSGGDD